MNLFVNVYNNEYSGTLLNSTTGKNDNVDLMYTSFSVNVNNTFTFSKGFSGELSGYYNAKGVDQLFVFDPNYYMGIGLQKTVMKGKGTLRFNFRDPFYWQKYTARIKYSDIDLVSKNRFDSRSITLNFSYRFGKSTVTQARRRQPGATEEQNRAGAGQGG
jgi:iron complex outermembrane receptor protein